MFLYENNIHSPTCKKVGECILFQTYIINLNNI
nr:MAG TPA: hypothetical protein [Bacteriophage sp.]